MSRELLWHEYPTEQRATYFRQFWDVSGYVDRPGENLDPESLKDIKPIHTWARTASLGESSSRRMPPGGEHLVLLVRGELLRRYPNSMVYACRAVWETGGRRGLGNEERHPVFGGQLQPDVSFFGFELAVPESRGASAPPGDPGWFFIIQEQPSEPRFGLDVPEAYGQPVTDWNDLSWGSVVADAGALDGLDYLDLTATLPETSNAENGAPRAVWHVAGVTRGSTAADLAYITLQRPMRVAWHASDMLTPRNQP